MVMTKKRNSKPKLTKEQLAERKKRATFSQHIDSIFVQAGFKKLSVVNRTFRLGEREHELDHLFIYENIIIIAEDTIRDLKQREKAEENGLPYNVNHKLEKKESAQIIQNNKQAFIDIIKGFAPDCQELQEYRYNEFKIFYFYFEYGSTNNSAEETRFGNLRFIDSETMNYFYAMSSSIKASFKYELFRFLGLKKAEIGKPNAGEQINKIKANIIYPETITGFTDDVRMVSFMMKPIDLIQNSCVLRKDSWEKDIDLYQRLITTKRIKSIRDFAVNNKTTFLNNIIVTLPDNVTFQKNDGTFVSLNEITRFEDNISIIIPCDFNSMAIIDGQHRVYAYYEDSDPNNETELKISPLRDSLHLLVTGIIYPNNEKYRNQLNRRKFESNLFVSINKNAKPVDPDTLIQVQSIMDPSSGAAISRRVIELLNGDDPFKDKFQLSKVKDAQIKTASIIQYALSSLVAAKDGRNKSSLYHYWLKKENKNEDYVLENSDDIKNYAKYAANCLKVYFKAVKSAFFSDWDNKESKILKVISLNAFIIAYRETLEKVGGPKDYDYYFGVVRKLNISFKNSDFQYAGAQYSKFARNEIIPLFETNNSGDGQNN